jgi:hypothetical protein
MKYGKQNWTTPLPFLQLHSFKVLQIYSFLLGLGDSFKVLQHYNFTASSVMTWNTNSPNNPTHLTAPTAPPPPIIYI